MLLALLGCCVPAHAEYAQLPELLRVRQRTVTLRSEGKTRVTRAYPETGNEKIDSAIAETVDRLAALVEPLLPAKVLRVAQADTGATVRVTGTRTASFLVLAHAAVDLEQVAVEFETAVYDLKTGLKLDLDAFFGASADEVIGEAVRTQLTAYFPDETPDPAALDQLAAGIREAPFTLSPAYLQLHYRADALYGGRKTLMHVKVPYGQLLEYMTPYGLQELDNSGYYLAALTFDDGPGRGVTSNLLMLLREWGAAATFFNVGSPMRNAHDYIAWEHDAGHAVQSHTYTHTLGLSDQAKMYKERDRFAREQIAIIGIAPTYMRAPGGIDKLYCKYDIGMPIIRWNCLSGDAVEDKPVDPAACISKIVHTLKDTAIVLMHNIRHPSVEVAALALDRLTDRGYLFVTVDELFAIRGIPLEKNVVYFGDEADKQE